MSFDEKYAALKRVEQFNVLSVLKLCDKVGLRECSKAIMKHSVDGKILLDLNESILQSWKTEISERQAIMLLLFVRNLKQDPAHYLNEDDTTYEDVEELETSEHLDKQNLKNNRRALPQNLRLQIEKFHQDRNIDHYEDPEAILSDPPGHDTYPINEPLYQELESVKKPPLVHKKNISKPINKNSTVRNILTKKFESLTTQHDTFSKKQRKISPNNVVDNPASPLLRRFHESKSTDDVRVFGYSPGINRSPSHGSVTELNNNLDVSDSAGTKISSFKVNRSNTLPLNHTSSPDSERKFRKKLNVSVSSPHNHVSPYIDLKPTSPKRELPPIPIDNSNGGYLIPRTNSGPLHNISSQKTNESNMEQEMRRLKEEEERLKEEVNMTQMQSKKLTKNLQNIQSRINEGRAQMWKMEENQLQMREADCRICIESSYDRRPKLIYRTFETISSILKKYWILTMVVLMLLSVFLSITVLSSVRS